MAKSTLNAEEPWRYRSYDRLIRAGRSERGYILRREPVRACIINGWMQQRALVAAYGRDTHA